MQFKIVKDGITQTEAVPQTDVGGVIVVGGGGGVVSDVGGGDGFVVGGDGVTSSLA